MSIFCVLFFFELRGPKVAFLLRSIKILFFLLLLGVIIQLYENVSKKHIQKMSNQLLLIVYQLNKAVA